ASAATTCCSWPRSSTWHTPGSASRCKHPTCRSDTTGPVADREVGPAPREVPGEEAPPPDTSQPREPARGGRIAPTGGRMDEGKWTVKSYAGAKGERMWAVVHRERPMFLAIVADRSVDALCEVPPAAVYWAKPEVPDDAASYRRRAIEVLRQRRDA